MGAEQSSESWLGSDITTITVSLVSPGAVVPILVVGILWSLAVVIPWAIVDALIGIVLGDGFVRVTVETLTLILLITVALVMAGFYLSGILAEVTPETVPTNLTGLVWWAGLPVVVILVVAYGIMSGIEIRTNVQFVALFGLLVSGSLLIATRALGVVRTAKGSPDIEFTATTVITGYVLVGGLIEAVTLFFDIPGLFGSRITDWVGLKFIYTPVILLLTILSHVSGSDWTELIGVQWSEFLGSVGGDSTPDNPGEIVESSLLFFDGGTDEGMFVALAVAFVGIPGLVAVIEFAWYGPRILSRRRSQKREFESALAAYERQLDAVEAHLRDGHYREAGELLDGSVEERRSACHALTEGAEHTIPDETRQRHETLSAEVQRLEAKQDIEELVDRQERRQTAYERAREAGNFDEAAERLDEARKITRECAERAEEFDIDYSLPLPADVVEAERAELDRQQTESELEQRSTQFQRSVESATDAISDGELSRAGTAVENALDELSAVETLEMEHDTTAPLDSTQRDIVSRIQAAVVTAVNDQFGIDISGDCECGREGFWTEAKARYSLSVASHAAANGEYDRAITRTASLQEELSEQLSGRQTSSGDGAVLARLAERARDQHDTHRREFIVEAINRADSCDPSEYEAVSQTLDRALSMVPETDAFDARQQSIIENDVRTAYLDVRFDGAQFLVDRGEELLERGDTAAAVERFEDAIAVLESTRDTIDRWESAEGVANLDDAGRMQKSRREADTGYADAQTERVDEIIHTGIDQFDEERYDTAGETFREAQNAAATAAERVEHDRQTERLRKLERVANKNAEIAHRNALGTARGSLIRPPWDPSRAPGDDAPTEIPSVPDVELEYENLELDQTTIGEGGNADVYHATVPTNHGIVELAVKKPRMSGTLHTETVERMMTEAETWQRLDDHNHIVSVLGYGSAPLPWIGMEYMDAGHLGERAGDLPLDQALWTAIAITRAVRHAHDRGVAHLDLKPANILFRSVEDGWDAPKVADWGLSKHLLEHSNSVDGMSPGYAGPEQFDTDQYGPTDNVTDVYQLGAVFYELFTGRPPFEGQTFEVINKIQSEQPAPPSEVADLPEALDEVLLTALATERGDRYEHVLYLRDKLQALRGGL